MIDTGIYIKKADGELELFDVNKLISSLKRIDAPDEIIDKVVNHILQEIGEDMTTKDIYGHAFHLLETLKKPVALRYSLRRALMGLGPTGFPFEKFVAEIFKTKGYQTLTDQVVKGVCADHEVDVVAWKPPSDEHPRGELIMIEVKFHNQLGLKSDLKVSLYVKARFDDLAKMTFHYGGYDFTLTEGMLITNTKFTSSAMKYAECQSIKIIGWNYPVPGSLEEMIESAGLHPVTCLSTLSEREKKLLIDQGVLLCRTLEEDHTHLKNIGLSDEAKEAVLEEVAQLTTAAIALKEPNQVVLQA